jgi:replication initiation and membrane attachment protein
MIKFNILPADTYTIVNRSILTNKDNETLIMLYQPIIGSDAVSLYLTLFSYLDKQELTSNGWTHHHLMTAMQTKLLTIINAKEKLEAIGLVKSYVKKGDINDYIYELYSPLSSYEFFNNPILNISLYNNVGKNEYERLVSFFKIPKMNLNGYEEVTSSFNEIFETKDYTSYEKLLEDLRRQHKNDLNIENKVDLNNVLTLIPEDMINIKNITKEVKDLIIKLSFIYDLDDSSLSNIIRNSINERKIIDKDLLRQNSRNYYKFEHEGRLPSIIFKNQPDYLRSKNNEVSKRAKLVYQMETYSPYDFLTLKNGNTKPNKNDLLLLEELLIDMALTPGVVNVLIDYVLRINNNKLIKTFVTTIATQWKRSNIKTVEEAMSFAEEEQKKTKKTTYKTKTSTFKPDWIDKTIDIDHANEEEKRSVEDLLKEFK